MNTVMLSKHFSLNEMTVTQQKIPNMPESEDIIQNMQWVCSFILEKVRAHYGLPVIVHSGYRSKAVNAAVGGSDSSQHCRGEAVDFHVQHVSVYEVAIWIRDNLPIYDQLILENYIPNTKNSGWVHCSITCRKKNRYDVRTKFKGDRNYYNGVLLDKPTTS